MFHRKILIEIPYVLFSACELYHRNSDFGDWRHGIDARSQTGNARSCRYSANFWRSAIDRGLYLERFADTIVRSVRAGLTQLYAFFIGVLWPILFPLSLLLFEPSRTRRRLIGAVLVIGCLIAVYTLVVMGMFGFTVRVANHCLVYDNPAGVWPGMELAYLLVTCGAFFIATDDRLHWIGVANLAGFGIAASFFSFNLPSVWCFCAAVISTLIYWYIAARNPQQQVIAA